MQSEAFFHQILELGNDWKVSSINFRKDDNTVEIHIQETPSIWERVRCKEDGGQQKAYDHLEARRWRHLNIFQYRCEIVCALPRGKCMHCGKVATLQAPWEGKAKGFTLAFESMCILLLREMTMSALAEFVGEHDTRLWRTLMRYTDNGMAAKDMSKVDVVCCDELNIRKGQSYATVFADGRRREVLFAVLTNKAHTWKDFRSSFVEHQGDPDSVRWISMDMSAAYQKGARENMPNAQLVFDKFHVIKLANDAADQVRRREMAMRKEDRPAIKGSRFVWLKNPENLTERQKATLVRMKDMNLVTATAYQMRLNLQEIYNESEDEIRAHKRLDEWSAWVLKTAKDNPLLAPMKRLAETIGKHMHGILAYWAHRLTNAYMEAV